MALQIRLSLPDFSSGINFTDPIIMERADNIALSKTVNSEKESIAFSLPANDPKIPNGINYLRWWECWDTETNTRLNYGPIDEISYTSGDQIRVSGPGRSAILKDFYTSVQTFYTPINQFIDDLRYENIAGQPRTTTQINKNTDSDYYELSDRSKDNAIDEQTGFIAIGRDTPAKGTIKTDSYWAGIGKQDYLILNLGDKYSISKAKVLLPWWSGPTNNNNRTYDWSLQYSNDNSTYTTAYVSPTPNHSTTLPPDGLTVYFDGTGFESMQTTVGGGPLNNQYWKLNITNVHAWYGNAYNGGVSDEWEWECNQSNVFQGKTKKSPTISGGTIDSSKITPASDCYASAVEIGLFRKIINKDTITRLAYQQIDSSNKQITFYHTPDSTEMLASGKKYEPGNFFSKISISPGATIKRGKYVVASGTSADLPAYSRHVTFDRATQVTYVDAWKGVIDIYAYAGHRSYTTIAGDYAVLRFRGVSLKWFATVPSGVSPGTVSIELRSKDNTTGWWGNWTMLNSSFTLPANVSSKKIWEITPESGTLQDETVYELRITNLAQNGYCGIDAFAGYWSGSYNEVNEDDSRVRQALNDHSTVLYDKAYTLGSIKKWVSGGYGKGGIKFIGDRILVYSRRGKNFGKITIGLYKRSLTSQTGIDVVYIPGGNDNGTLDIDLNNSYTVNQAIIFDSDKIFTGYQTLPWGEYNIGIYRDTSQGKLPIFLDGFGMHESAGLSVKFMITSNLDIVKNTAEALQLEWDITENGLRVIPRIGTDKDITLSEGVGTIIRVQDIESIGDVATMLIAQGADIDGLPLSTVVEDTQNRALMGRTVQRVYDSLRSTSDYFTLVGATRNELRRRRYPAKRVVVSLTGSLQGIIEGDSIIINKSPSLVNQRVRVMSITRNQSSSQGLTWDLECVQWPLID